MNSEDGKTRSWKYGAMNMMTKPNCVAIPEAIERLASIAVDAAFAIHSELGPGLLESAYEACFACEMQLRGINCQRQVAVPLTYKGGVIEVGFRADVLLEGKLLIELKAVEQLLPIHKAQLITYLKLTGLPLGLLINFNEVLVKDGIRRILNFHKNQNAKHQNANPKNL